MLESAALRESYRKRRLRESHRAIPTKKETDRAEEDGHRWWTADRRIRRCPGDHLLARVRHAHPPGLEPQSELEWERERKRQRHPAAHPQPEQQHRGRPYAGA